MTEMTRRDFVASACASVVACALTVKGVSAQTTRPGAPAAAGGKFTVDPKTLKEGFNDAFAAKHKVVVVLKDGKAYAMTAVCTHQGGTLRVRDNVLRCTKHQGEFDLNGKASKGKAEGELSRYGVELQDGKMVVNLDKIILPGDFEKEGSFVKVA